MHHITVIVPSFYPQLGGIEQNCLYTYAELAHKGLRIDIHTQKHSDNLSTQETYVGIKISRYQAKLGYYPAISQDTDLIALHSYQIRPHMFILFQQCIKKLLLLDTTPIILTPHGCFLPEWTDGSLLKKNTKKLIHRYLTSQLINFTVAHIRAVSEYEKSKLVEMGVNSKKITVIQNGVEDQPNYTLDEISSELRHTIKSAQPYLVQIGRIDHVKNYETVLQALANTNKDIKYIIVGKTNQKDPYFQKLQQIIAETGLQDRVIFMDELSGVSKYYVLDNAHVMVHMSKSESFGNTVNEALVRGIPCIVANNSNLKYLVQDNHTGYLIDTYDYISLAKKIDNIFSDENTESYNHIISNIKNTTKPKTWAQTAQEVLNLYSNYARK